VSTIFPSATSRLRGSRPGRRVNDHRACEHPQNGDTTRTARVGDRSGEDYARHRRELRIPTDRLCKLTDRVGLHPSMRAAADMIQDGRLAIVQGVGYPNPDRSHFRSMAIWQTARADDPGPESHGWLGRALDGTASGERAGAPVGPSAVFVGERDLPRALRGRRTVTTSFADPADLALAIPATAARSPGSKAKAGLIGETPRLGELVDGDLKWSIDFRRVYATLLDRWLGVPAEAVLGQRFEPLSMLQG
jgi:uncharacterized protein (DUF1501 family)